MRMDPCKIPAPPEPVTARPTMNWSDVCAVAQVIEPAGFRSQSARGPSHDRGGARVAYP